MKKIKAILTAACFAVCSAVPAFAQMPVYDAVNNIPIFSNWLTAIDTLYSNYDMVMNTITQIENQYRTIQQAVENAKNIDWDNIQFDGDFDIRNDIKDANRRVNKLLTQARIIRNSLTTTIINADGASYSLADLCGAGDDGKNFGTCVSDIYGYMSSNLKQAAAAAVGNLSEAQEMAIWAKYGISPRNYYMVAQASKQVRNKALECIGKTTDEARELVRTEKITRTNNIVKAAMEAKTADGTIPQGALDEASLLASQMMIDQCISLEEAVNDAAAVIAQKLIAEEKEKEAEASEKMAEKESEKFERNNLPGSFAAGRTKIYEE